MYNKLLLLAFVSLNVGVFAQSNSPYSAAGLGERASSNNAVFSGMGNSFVTYAMPSVLNTANPATYSYLRHQFPIFSLGVGTRLSFNQVGDKKEFNTNTGISEFAFGMSFAKRFGLAFGIKPAFKKGYNIVQKTPLLEDSVRYDYIGSGSLNKAFIGFSANIFNKDAFKWSVGANAGGIFGNIQDERRSSIESALGAPGGVESTSQSVRSFHYDLGTLIQFKTKKVNTFSIGGTFEPMQKLRSTYSSFLLYSASDVANPNSYMYLSGTGELKGKVQLGSSYNMGASYSRLIKSKRKDGGDRTSHLMIAASYSATQWSKYNDNFGDSTRVNNLKDASGYQIGVQFIPEAISSGSVLPKFFNRANYRVGYYSNTLPYLFQNNQLSEWAVTAGIGMPILVEKRVDSSIQLGVSYGKRGTNAVGSFNESFVAFNIGLFIAPSVNDRWFVKRKLD